MDTEFLEECDSLLDANSSLTIIDLKDRLRSLGYMGDFDNKPGILRFLQAEYYMKQEEISNQSDVESEIYIRLLKSLNMNCPPNNITLQQFFNAICNKTKKKIAEDVQNGKVDTFCGGRSLCPENLNPMQIDVTKRLIDHLNIEYSNRMKVLLKRLDVTIQSFNWSKRAVKNQDKIAACFQELRKELNQIIKENEFSVDVSDLMAARDCILIDSKTSEGAFRVKTKLNRILMKSEIPDRGGRAFEYQTPAKESFTQQEEKRNMPKFQARQGQAHDPKDLTQYGRGRDGRGGGGGGNRGRGRGGRGGSGNRGGNNSPGGQNLPFFGSGNHQNDNNRGGRGGGGRGGGNNNRGGGRGRGRGRGNLNYGGGFQQKNF